MEINKWISNGVTEKILSSFQRRILHKLNEPTTKRTVLNMESFSNPYGNDISDEETSFMTNVDSYDIFSSELENTFQSETIKNKEDEDVQPTITSSVFSVSEKDPEPEQSNNERKCGATVREKCVKIKIILPRKQMYSPLLAQNNIYANMLRTKSSNNDNVGKIVQELVLKKYEHFFIYYENKKKERNKKKLNIGVDTQKEHETTTKQYNNPDDEQSQFSKSVDDLNKVYSSPMLSNDHSVSDCEISDLLTSKYTPTTENSLSPCPTYTSIPILYDTEDETVEKKLDVLSKKTVIQDKIIHQIATVVEFCKIKRNLQSYIEAERLLLLANYERNLLTSISGNNSSSSLPVTGIVTITSISLSADENDLFIIAPSKIYYVILFKYNKSVVSSCSSIPDQDGRIVFDKEITIKNLSSDFVIEASIYALKVPECFHIRGKNGFSSYRYKHISPKRLFALNIEQKNLKSSFCLVGTFNFTIQDVGPIKHIGIRNMIPEFVILSQGMLQMKCDVQDIGHPFFSFVDLGFKIGNNPVRWNRLWGSIGKMDLKFWKYPDDNPDCPVVTINLQSCTNKMITNVDHETCLRPRTLLLEIEEPNENYQDIFFLLSFDSLDDMIGWKDQLNCLIPWIKRM